MMESHNDLHKLYSEYYFLTQNFKIFIIYPHQKRLSPQGHSLIIFSD